MLRSLTHSFIVLAALGIANRVAAGDEKHPFDARPQLWKRRAEPILSAYTTKENWCKVVVYSPHVIFHDGRFRMWYLGTSVESRTNDIVLGYAESDATPKKCLTMGRFSARVAPHELLGLRVYPEN